MIEWLYISSRIPLFGGRLPGAGIFIEKSVSSMLTSEDFMYQLRSENVDVRLMRETWTGHISLITKEDWVNGDVPQ